MRRFYPHAARELQEWFSQHDLCKLLVVFSWHAPWWPPLCCSVWWVQRIEGDRGLRLRMRTSEAECVSTAALERDEGRRRCEREFLWLSACGLHSWRTERDEKMRQIFSNWALHAQCKWIAAMDMDETADHVCVWEHLYYGVCPLSYPHMNPASAHPASCRREPIICRNSGSAAIQVVPGVLDIPRHSVLLCFPHQVFSVSDVSQFLASVYWCFKQSVAQLWSFSRPSW